MQLTVKEKLTYSAQISFEGDPREFEKIAQTLMKLKENGLKIDTVPLPTHPKRRFMIDTVPLPEKWKGLAINTVPLPEEIIEQLAIGTWPTPEIPSFQVIRWPWPKPFPGILPIVNILSPEIIKKLSEGMYRIKTRIDGGMNDPHFHLDDGIVLLTKERFREYMGHMVQTLGQELLP